MYMFYLQSGNISSTFPPPANSLLGFSPRIYTPFFVVSSQKLHLCATLSPFSSMVDASFISRQTAALYLETSTLKTVREQKSFTPTRYVTTSIGIDADLPSTPTSFSQSALTVEKATIFITT